MTYTSLFSLSLSLHVKCSNCYITFHTLFSQTWKKCHVSSSLEDFCHFSPLQLYFVMWNQVLLIKNVQVVIHSLPFWSLISKKKIFYYYLKVLSFVNVKHENNSRRDNFHFIWYVYKLNVSLFIFIREFK